MLTNLLLMYPSIILLIMALFKNIKCATWLMKALLMELNILPFYFTVEMRVIFVLFTTILDSWQRIYRKCLVQLYYSVSTDIMENLYLSEISLSQKIILNTSLLIKLWWIILIWFKIWRLLTLITNTVQFLHLEDHTVEC